MDDSSLVEGLRRHDPAAVRYLNETCLPSVWRFAFARTSADRHLAEDVVSEAVLALLKSVADPAFSIESPLAWLRTVVANKVVDHFRAAARVQHLIDQAQVIQPVSESQTPIEQQQTQEQREEIRHVMDSLPEQTRNVLEWKYLDSASVREISDRLGISEKAVESILFRGRREFRERMLKQQKVNEREGPVTRVQNDNELHGIDQPERAKIPHG